MNPAVWRAVLLPALHRKHMGVPVMQENTPPRHQGGQERGGLNQADLLWRWASPSCAGPLMLPPGCQGYGARVSGRPRPPMSRVPDVTPGIALDLAAAIWFIGSVAMPALVLMEDAAAWQSHSGLDHNYFDVWNERCVYRGPPKQLILKLIIIIKKRFFLRCYSGIFIFTAKQKDRAKKIKICFVVFLYSPIPKNPINECLDSRADWLIYI